MSHRIFIVSDTHFGHKGVCHFTREDGSPLRPWDDPDEMDEAMVQLWNETVREQDKVYHLGDVVINRRCLSTVGRLNGKKILIKGNHDTFRLKEYAEYFSDLRACKEMKGILFTHVPVHPCQLERFGTNVHGHLHSGRVMDGDKIDPRYLNVSVEHTDFKPITIEEVRERILAQQVDIQI